MESENSAQDFAKRTLKNYEFYIQNRGVINLMNFSVNLFAFLEEEILNSITDDWISLKLLKELKNNITSNYNEPLNLKNICIHIKNGINLFYLKTKTDNCNKITTLVIEDKAYKNRENCRFEITFSNKFLEKFFLEFSSSIIKHFSGENILDY